jgi:hypothetical protein
MPNMKSRKSNCFAVSATGTATTDPTSRPAIREPVTGPKPTPRMLKRPIQ